VQPDSGLWHLGQSRPVSVEYTSLVSFIPGLGQNVTNAILLICYVKREPLVDVNMARLLGRFFGFSIGSDVRHDKTLQTVAREILPEKNIKDFIWAILDFAALVCKQLIPLCNNCSLHSKCLKFGLQSKK
jgi:A/G-specific adenine glycosylase